MNRVHPSSKKASVMAVSKRCANRGNAAIRLFFQDFLRASGHAAGRPGRPVNG
jgi:hypothetical protein